MTTPSIEFTEAIAPARDPQTISTRQRLYWSLRREVWEHRAIWIVPVLFGVVAILGFFTTLPELPRRVASLTGPDPSVVESGLQRPFIFVALAMFAAPFLVGVFYCLDALQGERRDRSILFWKSMPVSDRTTVLSKVMMPLVVMPLIASAMCVILLAIMLVTSCAFLLVKGGDVPTFIAHLRFFNLNISALYAAIVIALWHAPIYGWLLFLSSWAGRAVLVWAFGPFVAFWAVASVSGASKFFESRMKDLLGGWMDAFTWSRSVGNNSFVEPALGNLLRMPHLWIGLVFASVSIVGAVYMRRHREPN
jgi:ABC-2 type transport system permease protein